MKTTNNGKRKRDFNIYPPGLDRKKVEKIIRYYDARQDEDIVGNALKAGDYPVWVEVPQKLVPQVRRMLAKYRRSA